jgi:hypothetical protein
MDFMKCLRLNSGIDTPSGSLGKSPEMLISRLFGKFATRLGSCWSSENDYEKLLVFALMVLIAAPMLRAADDGKIPPDEKDAKERLNKTPRHGEFVDITVPGAKVPLKSFIVYPEIKEKAPVVIVISEIYGLSDWIRSVADQLAAEGFIAIAST